jgi:uncharacterized ferritin-like protein (DUF455 family)
MQGSIRTQARAALLIADPGEKCAAVHALHALLGDVEIDPQVTLAPVAEPGRPERPELVPPARVPRRSPATPAGRAALIHAIAHIEFNAINLALDAVARFAGLPGDFYLDWLRVADEEATHYSMLVALLEAHGHSYGDFPAHDGLWEAACKSADDPLARLALVPRVLEARGLDVNPGIQRRFAAVGDAAAVAALELILAEEIGHVAIGNRWFKHLCAERNLEPAQAFADILQRYAASPPHPPFNIAARLAAGFSAEELAAWAG